MNSALFKTMFPRASKSTISVNCLEGETQTPQGKPSEETNKPLRSAKQPNKTEAAFKAYMDALRGSRLEFEPVKLRIGPNCYYAPDWGDMTGYNIPIFYEVKGGHIWDDSLVKFKAAKERHTWASFELWQKKQGTWTRLL